MVPTAETSSKKATSLATWFNDGRESALLSHLSSLPSAIHNDPSAVLDAIDVYSEETSDKFLMNIGPKKGAILREIVASEKPKVMVELGGYVGYSAINLANEMVKQNNGEKKGLRYFSLEINEEFAGIARSNVRLAGLDTVVNVVVGPSYEGIKRLKEEFGVQKIDVLLIDHTSPQYKPDIKLAESLGLVRPGTMVIADNVVVPGAPEYVSYVRGETEDAVYKYDSKMVMSSVRLAGEDIADGMELSKCVAQVSKS